VKALVQYRFPYAVPQPLKLGVTFLRYLTEFALHVEVLFIALEPFVEDVVWSFKRLITGIINLVKLLEQIQGRPQFG
jgi:hypothetical protein